MTITMNRNQRGGSDVQARREAALERLNGGPSRPSSKRLMAGNVRRGKPSRRAVQQPRPREFDILGPAPGHFYAIVVIVAMFVMLGLVMVLSSTAANQVGGDSSPYSIFTRQLAWAGLGLVGLLIAYKVPYHRWRLLVIPGAVLAAGAMMLPFVPGVGATLNDANSWVRFGSFGFQPSEILKLAAIAFLADFFARHQERVHIPRYGVIPMAVVAFGCSRDRHGSATIQSAHSVPRHRGQQGTPGLAIVAGAAQHREWRDDGFGYWRQQLQDGISPARAQ